jgi:hypothetical protein
MQPMAILEVSRRERANPQPSGVDRPEQRVGGGFHGLHSLADLENGATGTSHNSKP